MTVKNYNTPSNYTTARDMLDDTRRLACDLIVATEHGGAFFTDPDLRLEHYVELLEGLQVVQDTLRRHVDEGTDIKLAAARAERERLEKVASCGCEASDERARLAEVVRLAEEALDAHDAEYHAADVEEAREARQ